MVLTIKIVWIHVYEIAFELHFLVRTRAWRREIKISCLATNSDINDSLVLIRTNIMRSIADGSPPSIDILPHLDFNLQKCISIHLFIYL